MVQLFVGGQPVGVIPDPDGVIARAASGSQRVEFRDDAGNRIGVLTPDAPPSDPAAPLVPWDPTITQADLDRIAAGPFFTFDEMKKRLGWE